MTTIKKSLPYLFLIILCVGLILRLYNLGLPTLETDEISSVMISKLSAFQIIERNIHPSKSDIPVEEPPLPYFLIHFFLNIEDSDFMARLPFAIVGIITILAIYLLSKEWFNRRAALYSAFLLSISIYHIFYSQLARGYAGLVLFTILSIYFLWRCVYKGNKWNLIGLIFSNALGIYFHYAMLQVIIIEFLLSLFLINFVKPPKIRAESLIKIYIIIIFSLLILSVPLLGNILSTIKGRLGGQTIPFEFNPKYFVNLLSRYGAGNGPALIIYNFFFIYGLIKSFYYKRQIFISILIWVLFPFLLLAYTGYRYFFHMRYFIYIFPVYILLVGYGIANFINDLSKYKQKYNIMKYVNYLIVFIFLSINFVPLKLYYRMPSKMTDWKAIALYTAQNYHPDRQIYVESSFCIRELEFYVKKLHPDIKINSFNGNIEEFKKACEANSDMIWYVDNNPVFDSIVMKYFHKRKVFGSDVFYELGRRELIDWDRSWFGVSNIRRYFPVIYFNSP